MAKAPYKRGKMYWLPYCVEHGLRLHGVETDASTFVFYNGDNRADQIKARLRNFLFEPQLVRDHVLDSVKKAETQRLGYELSEDAVSWNVFVGLVTGGMLRDAASWLAGREIHGEPALYLWGTPWSGGELFQPLQEARAAIEANIRPPFHTEPDIMLVIPDQLIMCIEAKFTSGNTLARSMASGQPGEKPKDAWGLLERYFRGNSFWKGRDRVIDPERIGKKFHGQLFRNIVFAAAMAERCGSDWQVVSLTRRSSPQSGTIAKELDFADPTPAVRCYLKPEYREHFVWRSWEGLYEHLVKGTPKLIKLATYMEGKSAYFRPAFSLLVSTI